MQTGDFDLSKITVADLFRAKEERRRRLADLPFEEKVKIVKKLQSVVRQIREGQAKDEREDDKS